MLIAFVLESRVSHGRGNILVGCVRCDSKSMHSVVIARMPKYSVFIVKIRKHGAHHALPVKSNRLWDSTHFISTQPITKLGGEAVPEIGYVVMLPRCVDLIIIQYFAIINQAKMITNETKNREIPYNHFKLLNIHTKIMALWYTISKQWGRPRRSLLWNRGLVAHSPIPSFFTC